MKNVQHNFSFQKTTRTKQPQQQPRTEAQQARRDKVKAWTRTDKRAEYF